MKKIGILGAAFVALASTVFAENPASDFKYRIADDLESVVVTGIKGSKNVYEIPATIEDFPVSEVNFVSFTAPEGVKELSLKIPEGVKRFNFDLATDGVAYYTGPQLLRDCRVTIEQLPSTLEECSIDGFSKDRTYVTVKGSINSLENLEGGVTFANVELEEKNILIKAKWCDAPWYTFNFSNTNVEEVVFEEGVTRINEYGRLRRCENLRKITLPSTIKSIIDFGGELPFSESENISEVVIPESVEHISGNPYIIFGAPFVNSLSLKDQARFRKIFSDQF